MISSHQDLYAFKTSEIPPDNITPQDNKADCLKNYSIYEEIRKDVQKDTSKMLRHGARKVLYIRSDNTSLYKGFIELFRTIPENAPIVCESNNLNHHVTAGLSVVVKPAGNPITSLQDMHLQNVDALFSSDGKSGFPDAARIQFVDGKWHLAPPQDWPTTSQTGSLRKSYR